VVLKLKDSRISNWYRVIDLHSVPALMLTAWGHLPIRFRLCSWEVHWEQWQRKFFNFEML